MSFADRLLLWLHIGFAIFTIGPLSAAIMSTPRYIRARNLVVLRYLNRTTVIFALISLGVLIFGIVLGEKKSLLDKPWLTASLTLFVVTIALVAIIIRDQRKAINALQRAEAAAAQGPGAVVAADSATEAAGSAQAAGQPEAAQPGTAGTARNVATVARGRIAMMGAVVTVIWLVILVLMVWK